MIGYVLFVLVAALWLFHRLLSIFSTPINTLIQILNINIPKVPIVSINEIAARRICFHWDATLERGSGNHYKLYLNGAEIGISEYNQLSCVLENLKPDSYYQIDVIAVYGSNYKSKSSTVYVKTCKQDNSGSAIPHENPANIVSFLTKVNSSQLNLDTIKHRNTIGNASSTLRSRSNTLMMGGAKSEDVGVSSGVDYGNVDNQDMEAIKLRIKEIDQLKEVLENGQEELRSITDQQVKLVQDFVEKSSQLKNERDRQRQLKKSGDRTRQSIKSEGKLLEENSRYSKKDLKAMDLELESIESDISDKQKQMDYWKQELEKMKNNIAEIHEKGPEIKKQLQAEIQVVLHDLKEAQKLNIELDNNVKKLSSQRRQREKIKEEYIVIFNTLQKHTREDGCLDPKYRGILTQLKQLNKTVGEQVEAEIEIDAKSEEKWTSDQKREVSNCTEAYHHFHVTKSKLETLTSKKLERTLASINKSASEREQKQKQQLLQQQQQKLQSHISASSNPFPNMADNANTGLSYANTGVVPATIGSPPVSPVQLNNLQTYPVTNSIPENVSYSALQNNTYPLWNSQPAPLSSTVPLNAMEKSEKRNLLDTPMVESYLPTNLFENVLNETFLEDMRQYRYNFTEKDPNGESPLTNAIEIANSVTEPSTAGNVSMSNPLFPNLQSNSGRSSVSDTSNNITAQNEHNDISITNSATADDKDNDTNHSIASAFSPKRLFNFKKQPSISVASGFNYDLIVENGTEMVTNSLPFSKNKADSDGNKLDDSLTNTGGFTNKGVSRFFGRKNSTDTTEGNTIPILSLTASEDTNSGFSLGDFAAPSGNSLRVRDRSGSVNSGVLIPQSFHTAQVNFNTANSNGNPNLWGQSNQSTSSIFYPTNSNTLSIRGPSFDNDNNNLFSTTSQDSSVNARNNESSNSWSLFHINRNAPPTNIKESIADNEVAFLDDTNANMLKQSAGRKLFFRSNKDKQHQVNFSSPLGLSSDMMAPSLGVSAKNDDIPVDETTDTLLVSSPSQKKRKSIFSFASKTKDPGESPVLNPSPSKHNGSTLSLADMAVSNELIENDTVSKSEDEEQEKDKDKDKSSMASKLFPKSMRGLGISRRSSNASGASNANSQMLNNINLDGNDNNSLCTSAKSAQNEKIPSIME